MRALAVAGCILLSGCAIQRPIPHIAEVPNRASLSTLKSYADNSFALKIVESADQAYSDTNFRAPNEPTVIHYVFLQKLITPTFYAYGFLRTPTHYAIYNFRDIAKIVNNGNGTATVYMRDGQSFKHVNVESFTLYGCHEGTLKCKSATSWKTGNGWQHGNPPWFVDYNQYTYSQSLYMTGFYNFELAKPELFDPVTNIHNQSALDLHTGDVRVHELIPATVHSISIVRERTLAPLANTLRKEYTALNNAAREEGNARLRSLELAHAKMLAHIRIHAIAMRRHIHIGTETNCGAVFAIDLPMVGVQTAHGMQYIRLQRLYAPDVGCRFSGNVYAGPIFPPSLY